MSQLYKCDKCGEIFEPFDKRLDIGDKLLENDSRNIFVTFQVEFSSGIAHVVDRGLVRVDLCRECFKETVCKAVEQI